MNVNVKYLKDENGNVISPVTSTDSVYTGNNSQLTNIIENGTFSRTQLFTGQTNTDFTLSQSAQSFDLIEMNCYVYYDYRSTYFTIVPTKTSSFNVMISKMAISADSSTWFGTTSLIIFKTDGSVKFGGDGFNAWNSSYTKGTNDIKMLSVYGWKRMS